MRETEVCGGEAAAVPCFYRGRPDGGRGERGIFLIVSLSGEGESIFIGPARESFLPLPALRMPLFLVVDIAAQPPIQFRHGQEGRFSAQSGNSPRRFSPAPPRTSKAPRAEKFPHTGLALFRESSIPSFLFPVFQSRFPWMFILPDAEPVVKSMFGKTFVSVSARIGVPAKRFMPTTVSNEKNPSASHAFS